jgi:hypothetical protein
MGGGGDPCLSQFLHLKKKNQCDWLPGRQHWWRRNIIEGNNWWGRERDVFGLDVMTASAINIHARA